MRLRKLSVGAAIVAAAGLGLVVLILLGDGGADEGGAEPETEGGRNPRAAGAAGDGTRGDDGATAGPSAEELARREAAAVYRSYIAAIRRRDGEALCALLAPGFERELKPPVSRGRCARRLRRSIGFEDPRGFPVWAGTRLGGIESIELVGEGARVTATVITRFADREQPSIESDIAYLERDDDRWRIVRASPPLYRAVGKPDVPPQVIAPP